MAIVKYKTKLLTGYSKTKINTKTGKMTKKRFYNSKSQKPGMMTKEVYKGGMKVKNKTKSVISGKQMLGRIMNKTIK